MRRRPRRRPRFSLVEANRLRNTISQQQTFDALDVSRGDAIQSRTVCTVLHSITRTFPRVDLLSRVFHKQRTLFGCCSVLPSRKIGNCDSYRAGCFSKSQYRGCGCVWCGICTVQNSPMVETYTGEEITRHVAKTIYRLECGGCGGLASVQNLSRYPFCYMLSGSTSWIGAASDTASIRETGAAVVFRNVSNAGIPRKLHERGHGVRFRYS